MGVKYYYTNGTTIGVLWPFWISAGGLAYRPFWDHYLATGDQDFLRKRVLPAYKELALFYEDFLTVTGKDGNYMFAPSFSPESLPASTDASGPVLVNATMDISVCREVLTNLIQACEILATDADSVTKWKAMLAKMPPYMLEPDGTPEGMGLAHPARTLQPSAHSAALRSLGPATKSIPTARPNWPKPP